MLCKNVEHQTYNTKTYTLTHTMHCEAMYLDYVTHGGSQLINYLKKYVNFTKIQQCGKK
jgi:hypothetical protein